jgi:acetyl esterase
LALRQQVFLCKMALTSRRITMTAPDYQTLIDAETWAFIARTDACYPPDTASMGIADQRRIYDGMCRLFHQGYPAGIGAQDSLIAGVPCRSYAGEGLAKTGPKVLYLHGGGFVVGGLDSHDDVCAEICAETGLTVVAADYRLSPEHDHPAAFDDAMAVACALGEPILLVGDSAGGNLAAAVAHRLRGSDVRVLGQVLIYPGLGGDTGRGSYLTHAHAPMLTRDDVLFYAGIRHSGVVVQGDPTVSPLQDSDFSGLPPTVAISAECDPLADDARDYAAATRATGGLAIWLQEPGLVHGYLRARHSVARARVSFARICTAISALAKGEWPYDTEPK